MPADHSPEVSYTDDNFKLTLSKTGGVYSVSVSGRNLTAAEFPAVEAYVGDDPDGAELIANLA